MRGRKEDVDRDHLDKAHPGWAETSVRSVRNMVTGKISAQNEDGVALRKREKKIAHANED